MSSASRQPQPLTESLALDLKRFSCFDPSRPYTKPVEDNIRNELVKVWQAGDVSVLAVADSGRVLGVVAYSFSFAGDSKMGYSQLLATVNGLQRDGIGSSLKAAAMDEMRSRGCLAVSSYVHKSNVEMHCTNAQWHFDSGQPDEDDYILVVIAL